MSDIKPTIGKSGTEPSFAKPKIGEFYSRLRTMYRSFRNLEKCHLSGRAIEPDCKSDCISNCVPIARPANPSLPLTGKLRVVKVISCTEFVCTLDGNFTINIVLKGYRERYYDVASFNQVMVGRRELAAFMKDRVIEYANLERFGCNRYYATFYIRMVGDRSNLSTFLLKKEYIE